MSCNLNLIDSVPPGRQVATKNLVPLVARRTA